MQGSKLQMEKFDPASPKWRIVFLFLLSGLISILFLRLIWSFVMALLIAALMAGLMQPVYHYLERRFRYYRVLASGTTVLLTLFLIIMPLLVFLGILAEEAISISKAAGNWVQTYTQTYQFQDIPMLDILAPYQDELIEKAGELATKTGVLVTRWVAAGAKGTVGFILMLFIILYAMFHFLIHGRAILDTALRFTPLTEDDRYRLLHTFTSVTRATLKGCFVIGIVQGGLAGASLALAGIQGAIFWSAIMAVLAIIPGIGTAIIWIPAVIFLLFNAQITAAISVAAWCAVVVGTADNILRPILVGKDTRMPDLLVFVSTMGGLFLLGAAGIVIGPIIGALFLTAWELLDAAVQTVRSSEE
jgi:predicted PurR-regulated permease PerM